MNHFQSCKVTLYSPIGEAPSEILNIKNSKISHLFVFLIRFIHVISPQSLYVRSSEHDFVLVPALVKEFGRSSSEV